MFKSININNFKGISNLKIDNLSFVNLIAGKNNIGKTSILEAIFLYIDRHNPSSILGLYNRRGVQSLASSPETLWGPIFNKFDLNRPIEIVITDSENKKQSLKININKNYTFPVQTQPIQNGFRAQIKTDNQLPKFFSLDFTYQEQNKSAQIMHLVIDGGGIRAMHDYVPALTKTGIIMLASVKTNYQEDAIRFGMLDIDGKIEPLVQFIQESIEPRLLGLSSITLESQSYIHAQLKGLDKKIPIAQMGDGMVRLISILINISTNANGYLFIDEIENGIHYSVLPKIWAGILKAAKEYNCQVFATTHSYECMEAVTINLDENLQDCFRYIRLDREDEKILSYVFDFEETKIAIDNKWEIR